MKETVFRKLECPKSGARWTITHFFIPGTVCNFSGCSCGRKVNLIGYTSNLKEAAGWFRSVNN